MRITNINGIDIRLNFGHGYNRSHSGGDVRSLGLSMNTIESFIVRDVAYRVNFNSIPVVPNRYMERSIYINGHVINYRMNRLPNGEVVVSTYYPK